MRSILQKVKNNFDSDICILEKFIEEYQLTFLRNEHNGISHIPKEEGNHLATVVYRVTKQEVEMIKRKLWKICGQIKYEDGLWSTGAIQYVGEQVGFYLGMSFELEHELAIFWLE